jgi:uncharacterized hydantoinase/oxoprolinase family protein
MSESTIARAAKALKAEADRLYAEGLSPEMRDFFASRENAGWESLVRAVLTSIREPTEEMIRQGARDGDSTELDHELQDEAARTWQAMVDVVLAEDFVTSAVTASE